MQFRVESAFRFFIRFTIAYVALLVATFSALHVFYEGSASFTYAPVLFVVSIGCFYSYAKANTKVFSGPERVRLILAALGANVLSTLAVLSPTYAVVPVWVALLGSVILLPVNLLIVIIGYAVSTKLALASTRCNELTHT